MLVPSQILASNHCNINLFCIFLKTYRLFKRKSFEKLFIGTKKFKANRKRCILLARCWKIKKTQTSDNFETVTLHKGSFSR